MSSPTSAMHAAPPVIHSARSGRSDCSSHSGRGLEHRDRVRRKSLTTMSHIPSVQQLAAIDKAVAQGAMHKLVLEPDLIAALEKRVKSLENNSGSVGGPIGVPGERRASIGSFTGSMREGTSSKENSQRATSSMNPLDIRKSRPTLPASLEPEKAKQERNASRRNSKVDPNWGMSPMSGEATYQLIPTEIAEEPNPEAEAKKKKRLHSRASTRDSRLENLPIWRQKGQEVLQGICFQTAMALLIVSNSLVIGLETDIKTFQHWDTIENWFLFAFFCELLLKTIFQGVIDLFDQENPDFNWNVFDSFIVTLGLVDFAVGLLTTAKSGGVATLFRIIRLLRILRIIRIVKFLKQLYLLAFGLAEAAQAVFWVTILMTFILYVCSIIMVKTIGRPPDTDPNQEFLERHFGAVLPSMLSLFVLMSSPNLPVYQDQTGLLEDRPFLALFLVGFIVFGSFGMVALLTGVISESMFEKNDMRKEEERIEHEKLRLDVGMRCEELYERFEKNDEDEVLIEDIKDETMVEDMAKTFEAVGVFVTAYDLRTMIDYLDVDGSGTINKDEFLRGMLVLAEGLRPITVQEVHYDVGVCKVKLERIEAEFLSMVKEWKVEAENLKDRKILPPNSGTSTDCSYGDRESGVGSAHSVLENLSEQIQDLAKQQKQMCRVFQDLDGRIRDITRRVQVPLGEDIASLKAYLSTSLQELGQHIIQQCSKERSFSSSRWNDAKFGVPLETRSQASCGLSTTREPSPRAGHDTTWPSLSFSAAGSSAEQAGGGTSSATAGGDQKFFTFELDQLVPSTRQQAEEACIQPEVADSVVEAARQPSFATASTATAASTSASAAAIASLSNHQRSGPADDAMSNLPEASISRVTSRSADVSVIDAHGSLAQGSLSASQVHELVSWQQRIESELRRVSQLAQQDGGPQSAQTTQPGPAPPQSAQVTQVPQFLQLLQPAAAAQSAQSAHSAQSAQHAAQQLETAQAARAQALPARAGQTAQVAQAAPVPQPVQLAHPTYALSSSAGPAPPAEPARHPTAQESANAASLAELLNQMRELVTNHEAFQRLNVPASADGDTSRSNEVLDCDSG